MFNHQLLTNKNRKTLIESYWQILIRLSNTESFPIYLGREELPTSQAAAGIIFEWVKQNRLRQDFSKQELEEFSSILKCTEGQVFLFQGSVKEKKTTDHFLSLIVRSQMVQLIPRLILYYESLNPIQKEVYQSLWIKANWVKNRGTDNSTDIGSALSLLIHPRLGTPVSEEIQKNLWGLFIKTVPEDKQAGLLIEVLGRKIDWNNSFINEQLFKHDSICQEILTDYSEKVKSMISFSDKSSQDIITSCHRFIDNPIMKEKLMSHELKKSIMDKGHFFDKRWIKKIAPKVESIYKGFAETVDDKIKPRKGNLDAKLDAKDTSEIPLVFQAIGNKNIEDLKAIIPLPTTDYPYYPYLELRQTKDVFNGKELINKIYPIHLAAELGFSAGVRHLIQTSKKTDYPNIQADLNDIYGQRAQDVLLTHHQETPWLVAAKKGQWDTFKIFIDQMFCADTLDSSGNTMITCLISDKALTLENKINKLCDLVEVLDKKKVEINKKSVDAMGDFFHNHYNLFPKDKDQQYLWAHRFDAMDKVYQYSAVKRVFSLILTVLFLATIILPLFHYFGGHAFQKFSNNRKRKQEKEHSPDSHGKQALTEALVHTEEPLHYELSTTSWLAHYGYSLGLKNAVKTYRYQFSPSEENSSEKPSML